MEENKATETIKNPSYEQLEKDVASLKSMNNQLIMQLQQVNISTLFKRLDYLFKVVEFREAFNKEFVNNCVEEIEIHITPPKEEEGDKEAEGNK